MSMRTIDDLMIRDVAVIRSDADVHELEQKLLRDGIHGMPVVDGNDTLVGVVSQTDLIAWHYLLRALPGIDEAREEVVLENGFFAAQEATGAGCRSSR